MNHPITRTAFAVAMALATASCTTTETPPANPQSVVDQRVSIMKRMGGALGAAASATQDKNTQAAAKAKLAAAQTGATRLSELFPRGTALGDPGVKNSRALSTIFSNRADFDRKLETLNQNLAALDAALAKPAETSNALTAAKTTCKSCHDKYRAAED